jgi:hypothetical protein
MAYCADSSSRVRDRACQVAAFPESFRDGLPPEPDLCVLDSLLTHRDAQRLSQKGEGAKRRYASAHFVLSKMTEGCAYAQ